MVDSTIASIVTAQGGAKPIQSSDVLYGIRSGNSSAFSTTNVHYAVKDYFTGDNTGATNVASALQAHLIANVNTATGVATAVLPGEVLLNWDVDMAALATAGVRKVKLRSASTAGSTILYDKNSACIFADNSQRAGTAVAVSSIALAAYDGNGTSDYDQVHRLSVSSPATYFAKDDVCSIYANDVPEYSNSRIVGESFRVLEVDDSNGYVWVAGRLEYALDGLYTTNIYMRKLDDSITFDIEGLNIFPLTDPNESSLTTRYEAFHFIGMRDLRVEGTFFGPTYAQAVRMTTCADSFVRRCDFSGGENWPSREQYTYGLQTYGMCYNVWMENCYVRGYRHGITTDGYDGALSLGSFSTTSPHFAVTSGSSTVTVTSTAHGLVTGQRVEFTSSSASTVTFNGITLLGQYVVTVVDANSFTISATTANSSSAYSGGSKSLQSLATFTPVSGTTTVTVRQRGHALSNGDYLKILTPLTVGGRTVSGSYLVANRTSTTFEITLASAATNSTAVVGYTEYFLRYRITSTSSGWWFWGQPSYCGARDTRAVETHGSPFDTHVEGANIQFVNCLAHNCRSGNQQGVFIGAAFQIRARRCSIINCSVDNANKGISWKAVENGANDWLRVINTHITTTQYSTDSGLGVAVEANTSEGAAPSHAPTLYLLNSSIDQAGTSISVAVPVKVEINNTVSSKPHRGHVTLVSGASLIGSGVRLDSRSADLLGAQTANRVLFGIQMTGTSSVNLCDVIHTLGTDATKHTPQLVESTDSVTGKGLSIVGYREIDPSNIGPRPIIKAGQESYFNVGLIKCDVPRVQIATASGAVSVLAETDVLLVKKTTGAATTVNFTPYKKPLVIKDAKGDAATNNITVTPSTGSIMGESLAATYVMQYNGQSITTLYDGTNIQII